ncbi:MAG: potassium transporter [Gammaproteobacteria bacterium]|nr:TrkH family potassium uptake protein [Gammaproteobacteria bacterium]MYF28177.1 potassium transporter [Gammaproteobacteria bacterium]MYK47725.1 potassium transporter [Gammaproteobacteria bacterium]
MRITPILRVTGGLLMLFSVAQLVPVGVALIYNESTITPFLAAFAISFLVGGLLWVAGRGEIELRSRDGFLITVLFYLGLGFTGAVPFLLAPSVGVAFTDGVFESLSGLTTTGATVLAGLDDLPRSVLLYRQLLQWLGGMGIIVLAVAVLPMLGVGGMQLYRAESPGPVKDTKLTPRIAQTAKALWYLYLGFTVACALAYYLGGMSVFDAICYSFSTVSIGGFAPHDASVGYFDSVAIESVAIVFMVLSGMSFALHFTVLAKRSFAPYARDNELRLYICALGTVAAIVIGVLLLDGMAPSQSIREGLFQAVSIATTTGFTTTDHSAWPMLAPVLMIFAAFAGGCAGSTAGGLKMYRVLLIYRQGIREIRRLIHPNGIFHIKLGEQLVPDRVVDAVWGFFAVYLIVFVTMVCILLGVSDLDFLTAFSAVAANLNNLGPGLGDAAANYQALPPATKWVLMLAMVLGRLEIFTLLVVLTPEYWRG